MQWLHSAMIVNRGSAGRAKEGQAADLPAGRLIPAAVVAAMEIDVQRKRRVFGCAALRGINEFHDSRLISMFGNAVFIRSKITAQ